MDSGLSIHDAALRFVLAAVVMAHMPALRQMCRQISSHPISAPAGSIRQLKYTPTVLVPPPPS